MKRDGTKELGRIADALEGLLALERERARRAEEQIERAEDQGQGLVDQLRGLFEPLLAKAGEPTVARIESVYRPAVPAVELGGMRVAAAAPTAVQHLEED